MAVSGTTYTPAQINCCALLSATRHTAEQVPRCVWPGCEANNEACFMKLVKCIFRNPLQSCTMAHCLLVTTVIIILGYADIASTMDGEFMYYFNLK